MLAPKLSLTVALILVIVCCGRAAENAQEDKKINCYTCDSSNANCIGDPSKVSTCESKKCFTKTDGGKVSRGCLAENDTACTNQSGCYFCTTDKCNVNLICKNCLSSSDPDCVKTEAKEDKYNSVCSLQQTSCISLIREEDKHLERRCAKEKETCPNEKTCSTCPGTNCNVGIFPTDRRRCYQCEGSKCGDVNANSDTIKSLPCLLYNADDKCYTIGGSATNMTRGCISDSNKDVNKCSDPASNKDCSACDIDNCNNLDYQRDQKITCVQCKSTDDPNCLFDQTVENAKGCKEKLLYNQKDSCYLERRSDKSVIRGCLYDRAKDEVECKSPDCVVCDSGNGCNRQEDASFTCIRCRSDMNATCINKPADIGGSTCRNQQLTSSNKDCFTGTWNNVVIRGCLVDADERQQIICNDKDNKQCTKCFGKDCNTDKANSATSMQLVSSLFALCALTLWYF